AFSTCHRTESHDEISTLPANMAKLGAVSSGQVLRELAAQFTALFPPHTDFDRLNRSASTLPLSGEGLELVAQAQHNLTECQNSNGQNHCVEGLLQNP